MAATGYDSMAAVADQTGMCPRNWMQWMEVAASSIIRDRHSGTMDNGRFQGDSGPALPGLQVTARELAHRSLVRDGSCGD